jgi:tRNA-2-methylthio-N6-dimethylallyladenosine synthase
MPRNKLNSYLCNLQISYMLDLVSNKVHDEARQGEAFAPFTIEPNEFQRKFYIESYGCQMNFADSEVVASILNTVGFGATRNVEEAQLIFLNTCSIREKAEQTVRKRLTEFKRLKRKNPALLVGVLGCMAERLKSKFLEEERLVDLVVGPMPTANCLISLKKQTRVKRP